MNPTLYKAIFSPYGAATVKGAYGLTVACMYEEDLVYLRKDLLSEKQVRELVDEARRRKF